MKYQPIHHDHPLTFAPIEQGYQRAPRGVDLDLDLTPDEAKDELIRVLELDDDMTWADVVTYAAKTKGTVRVCLNTVRRRTRMLAEAVGHATPEDATWPEVLQAARAAHTAVRASVRARMAGGT